MSDQAATERVRKLAHEARIAACGTIAPGWAATWDDLRTLLDERDKALADVVTLKAELAEYSAIIKGMAEILAGRVVSLDSIRAEMEE